MARTVYGDSPSTTFPYAANTPATPSGTFTLTLDDSASAPTVRACACFSLSHTGGPWLTECVARAGSCTGFVGVRDVRCHLRCIACVNRGRRTRGDGQHRLCGRHPNGCRRAGGHVHRHVHDRLWQHRADDVCLRVGDMHTQHPHRGTCWEGTFVVEPLCVTVRCLYSHAAQGYWMTGTFDVTLGAYGTTTVAVDVSAAAMESALEVSARGVAWRVTAVH